MHGLMAHTPYQGLVMVVHLVEPSSLGILDGVTTIQRIIVMVIAFQDRSPCMDHLEETSKWVTAQKLMFQKTMD